MPENKSKNGLPISGYTPQSAAAIAMVNAFKETEELLLQELDNLASSELDADPRWLAIGRSQIEQGFMAINRSVFKPERLNK